MRWRRLEQGATRTVTRFLWFPVEIDNETRWLERATWEERIVDLVSVFSGADRGQRWEKQRWIDDQ